MTGRTEAAPMGGALRAGIGRLAWLLVYVVPGPRWAKLAVVAAAISVLVLARNRRT